MSKQNTVKLFSKISTIKMPREEWLTERRKGIGGSDAAAIMGVNPWRSAYSVWADKMGHSDDKDNEAMRQGRDFEEYVARRFVNQSGLRIARVNSMLVSKEYPWMRADIDRRVIGDTNAFIGLECKTSRDIYLTKFRNGDYPTDYYAQCVHYMAITGAPYWYLAVLVYGTDMLVFKIERDEEDVARLIEAERIFWEEHVLTGIQPPTDGTDSTADAIKRVYPTADESVKPAKDEQVLAKLWGVKKNIKDLEDEKAALENAVKAEIGTSTQILGVEYSATWKDKTKSSLDTAALLKAHPALNLKSYNKTTSYRELRLKYEPKNDDTLIHAGALKEAV